MQGVQEQQLVQVGSNKKSGPRLSGVCTGDNPIQYVALYILHDLKIPVEIVSPSWTFVLLIRTHIKCTYTLAPNPIQSAFHG